MRVLDLFSGIGGFSLGLERAGFETVAFCEIEEFPRKVLKKHWPDVPIYEDVRNVTRERLVSDGIGRIDVVTGGFPCQDLSVAGNQKGIEAERSGLWSELCRIIGDIRPRYAIVENVTALISGDNGRWFGKVLGDLAEIGYDAEWRCISASELGAHHHRDRVWIICYPSIVQRNGGNYHRENSECEVPEPRNTDSKDDDVVYSQYTRQTPAEIRESNKTGNGSNAERSGPTSEFAGPGHTEILADTISIGQSGQRQYVKPLFAEAIKNWQTIDAESGCISGIWMSEPDVGRVATRLPDDMDRLEGLGNAVVPQIPELIGRAIMEIER